MSKNICTTKNVSCWCFWMLKFNTVWNHLQEQCLGLEENLQNRRFGGHWESCGCEHSPPASPTCRSAKAGRVQHGKHCTRLLLQHLLSAPAALEVLLLRPGSATLLSRFGHLNTPLAGTASPGEDGGRAWHREIVLPNWRCQAVVEGEPSASVQPASVATARHRWCVGGCCRITKLSLQNTMWILEGTFLDSPDSSTRPLCLYLLMPGWTWNGCFQSSWDRCLWGSLIFWGSNIPTWVRRGAGAWNPREVGGTAGVGKHEELVGTLSYCTYSNVGDGAWGDYFPCLLLCPLGNVGHGGMLHHSCPWWFPVWPCFPAECCKWAEQPLSSPPSIKDNS